MSWLDALVYPHTTREGGATILAGLQARAAGEGGAGATPGRGTGKRYDEQGRLISETYEQFAAWCVAAGLMTKAEMAA